MKKVILVTFLLFTVISANCQKKKINNYKYIIVPEKFDFLKIADQHQTSSLTKFLLEKKGFKVFLSNEQLPNELNSNRCLGITANVVDDSNIFSVKSKIELKDCSGKVLYTSKVGKSKSKEYKKGYHEAIRKAFATMSDLEYKYVLKKEETIVEKDEVKSEIKLPIKKDIPVKNIKDITEVAPVKKVVSKDINEISLPTETLYAQAKSNGFQLVNTTPAIVFQILKTNVKGVYIIKDKNGVMYKSGETWTAEYYDNNKLVVKIYSIKF